MSHGYNIDFSKLLNVCLLKNFSLISTPGTSDFSTLYTKIPQDKLLDILYKIVDFMFKGGNRDYIVINKQGCTSWSSDKRWHHFICTKSLFKKKQQNFFHITVSSLLE